MNSIALPRLSLDLIRILMERPAPLGEWSRANYCFFSMFDVLSIVDEDTHLTLLLPYSLLKPYIYFSLKLYY